MLHMLFTMLPLAYWPVLNKIILSHQFETRFMAKNMQNKSHPEFIPFQALRLRTLVKKAMRTVYWVYICRYAMLEEQVT